MSFYSITESHVHKPSSNDYLKYQKLSKFNKFYLSNNTFPCKYSLKSLSINNPLPKKKNVYKSTTFLSPNKLNRAKSQNFLNNATKIKNIFNPDILDTKFISQPKKKKKITHNLEMPNYNSFLYKKIKLEPFHSNIIEYINGNKHNLLRKAYCKKPTIKNNNFYFKKKDSISDSINLLIERAHRSSKKAESYMINNFDKRLLYDKRENLKEYNQFINILQTNLNKSKSKSKIKRFFYE